MRTLDFAPLYRSSVGFDHLFNLLETASRGEQKNTGYPPYNIEAFDKDRYQITLAVAGFAEEQIDIHTEQNKLVIKGTNDADNSKKNFLHQGIANRNFERTFELAAHVKVVGADLKNGLLTIDLEREIPDAMKPRKIEINRKQIEG